LTYSKIFNLKEHYFKWYPHRNSELKIVEL
jgi:hypothetical protein